MISCCGSPGLGQNVTLLSKFSLMQTCATMSPFCLGQVYWDSVPEFSPKQSHIYSVFQHSEVHFYFSPRSHPASESQHLPVTAYCFQTTESYSYIHSGRCISGQSKWQNLLWPNPIISQDITDAKPVASSLFIRKTRQMGEATICYESPVDAGLRCDSWNLAS